MSTGWNLISIQVGGTLTPPQFTSGLATNSLIQIWGYDAASRSWEFFKTNTISTLANLAPGHGYWVQLGLGTSVSLTGAVWSGSMALAPGWNLVGFPGLPFDPAEQLDLASVFRQNLANVPRVWRFDAGSAQRFVGADALAQPALTDLKAVEPGRGYWVYSLASVLLTPSPAVALPADTDLSPLQVETLYTGTDPRYSGLLIRLAGPEDSGGDLNGNGILDAPFTQDVVQFRSGVNQQTMTIANRGAGLMNWTIDDATDWLTATPPAGVTGTEIDSVEIRVDRSGLLPGLHRGQFAVHAGGSSRRITVLLHVPTVAGDYRGQATIQRVNGKSISIGKVDLNLSMFVESGNPAETRFRAVINRDRSLLFPHDVFLAGVFYQHNDFSLKSTFLSAAADRNAPPYTTFQHSTSAYGDKDHNGDGKLDNLNPFPFPLYRQVTLLGRRINPDRLEGDYIEAVENVLPDGRVIYLEGTFQLDRETLEPTSTSRFKGGATPNPVSIGGSQGGRISYTNTLDVAKAIQVHGVTAIVRIDFPSMAELSILLRSPTGQLVSLFQNETNVPPSATFQTSAFNGSISEGTWSVIVSWNGTSSEGGFFRGWELDLHGIEVFTASGTVVTVRPDGTTDPLADATVRLSGGNLIPQSNTTTNGTFRFEALTENSYSVDVSRPGFHDRSISFRITNRNVQLGTIALQPTAISGSTLNAAPNIGSAPLHVTFLPRLTIELMATLGDSPMAHWSFGDGTTRSVPWDGGNPVGHRYTIPGSYECVLLLEGTAGSHRLTNAPITALAGAPNVAALPGATLFISGGAFIGSIASPLASQNLIELSGASTVYQESRRDMAAFDLDRFPFQPPETNFRATQEDTDYGLPPFGPGFQTYTPPTVNGVTKPDRFRLICTLGGAAFGTQPARAGNFILHVGRIED